MHLVSSKLPDRLLSAHAVLSWIALLLVFPPVSFPLTNTGSPSHAQKKAVAHTHKKEQRRTQPAPVQPVIPENIKLANADSRQIGNRSPWRARRCN